jgi:hypothetical protein
MLESMMAGTMGIAIQVGACLFTFGIIGVSIPFFCVISRLNLTSADATSGSHDALCSRSVGNILAVYLPFGVSWLLFNGQDVTKLLSWGGIIFLSFVAFILPLVLTLHVVKLYNYQGSVPVYLGLITEKRAELISLWVLLIVAILAVLVTVVDNVFA